MDWKTPVIAGLFALVGAGVGAGLPLYYASQAEQARQGQRVRAELMQQALAPTLGENPLTGFFGMILRQYQLATVMPASYIKAVNKSGARLCFNEWTDECEKHAVAAIQATRRMHGLEEISEDEIRQFMAPAYAMLKIFWNDPKAFIERKGMWLE
jgi:hypothetical protein